MVRVIKTDKLKRITTTEVGEIITEKVTACIYIISPAANCFTNKDRGGHQ